MTYTIASDCIDTLDRSCIEVCPVDCIYVGERKSYINAQECIDCGACEQVCPVEAIVSDRVAKKDQTRSMFMTDENDFFHTTLPGREGPLGDPGGQTALGEVGVDTPLVSAYEKS